MFSVYRFLIVYDNTVVYNMFRGIIFVHRRIFSRIWVNTVSTYSKPSDTRSVWYGTFQEVLERRSSRWWHCGHISQPSAVAGTTTRPFPITYLARGPSDARTAQPIIRHREALAERITTSRLAQNGRCSPNDIFKSAFLNGNNCIFYWNFTDVCS